MLNLSTLLSEAQESNDLRRCTSSLGDHLLQKKQQHHMFLLLGDVVGYGKRSMMPSEPNSERQRDEMPNQVLPVDFFTGSKCSCGVDGGN
jgi:hypothetical protein